MSMSLQKKLRLQAGQSIALVNLPPEALDVIGELPPGTAQEQLPGRDLDFILLFAQNSAELSKLFPVVQNSLRNDGLLWIAYPKKSAKLDTDLSRDQGWTPVFTAGFRPVTQIAFDQTWSVLRFRPVDHQKPEDQVDAQYKGKKKILRPIYERILDIAQSFGDDIAVNLRKSYVALSRRRQFAVIAPSTNNRVDLGLRLGDRPFSSRLKEAGGFGSGSITHKVALTAVDEVDEEVRTWLHTAYEAN